MDEAKEGKDFHGSEVEREEENEIVVLERRGEGEREAIVVNGRNVKTVRRVS